jgi:hypothetical protein
MANRFYDRNEYRPPHSGASRFSPRQTTLPLQRGGDPVGQTSYLGSQPETNTWSKNYDGIPSLIRPTGTRSDSPSLIRPNSPPYGDTPPNNQRDFPSGGSKVPRKPKPKPQNPSGGKALSVPVNRSMAGAR